MPQVDEKRVNAKEPEAAKTSLSLSRNSYEVQEGWLRYLSIVRLGVLSFLAVGAVFFRDLITMEYLLLFLLYTFGFATSGLYLWELIRDKAAAPRHTGAQVLVDFSVVAVTVSFTDGPTSFFTFIFVIVVLEAGLLLGPPQGFLVSSLATAFMLEQLLATSYGALEEDAFDLWYAFLVQCLAFYLTAFISGYWNQRLNRMQQFQREILDNMNSGFLITDGYGFVTGINRAAKEILLLPDADFVGQRVGEVLRVTSGAECPVITALRSGRDFISYEFHAATGEGNALLLGLTTNRIVNSNGDVTGLIASFMDLTEMDAMRQEIRRQDRLAVVGELAAGLAHEIRNPVAVIRGAVDEMGSQPEDGELTSRLRAIAMKESDHLNDIVSGFLDFAREPSITREQFDLRDVIHEVADLVEREKSATQDFRIEVQCPDAPCYISADQSKIKQLFVNLAKNGIEAMEGRGALSISVMEEDGPIEVRFEDEGPGIQPDRVARIFEPFYTTKASGVGMGLAVCQRIVMAHDGTIRAFSREGGGCSMIVRLPRAQSED